MAQTRPLECELLLFDNRTMWPKSISLLCLVAVSTCFAQSIRVVNSASFLQDTNFAPGAIVTIFGSNLSKTTAAATDASKPPVSLGDVTVNIAGMPAALFAVSPSQINAVIDPSAPSGPATVTVTSPTGTFTANINIQSATTPGLFALSSAGTGDGAILNAVTFGLGPFAVSSGTVPTYLAIYATGLAPSASPSVSIGGVNVPVQYFGWAPCCVGLQQINVPLAASLAGAGRLEIAVSAGGNLSNTVETVVLPADSTRGRSRRIAGVTLVPNSRMALVPDEADDVIRVVDLAQRAVVRTIVLPSGAQPSGVAVNDIGTLGLVAERGRGTAGILDTVRNLVVSELPVGAGPSAVAIAGGIGLVANQFADTVSLIHLARQQVVATIPVGRAPSSVASDSNGQFAYVANQESGDVSVIDIAAMSVVKTLKLGQNARPRTLRLIPSTNFAAVTEPSMAAEGRVEFLDITSGLVTALSANPDRSGGSADMAVSGSNAYFANQAAGTVSVATLRTDSGISLSNSKVITLEPGTRALAVDRANNLLIAANQGAGSLSLVDLTSGAVVGRIDAVKSESESAAQDNRSDREHGGNIPVIASIVPKAAAAGSTLELAITGTNLAGATRLIFPGSSSTTPDPAFTVGNLSINPSATQVVVTVTIGPGATKGDHFIRLYTPNGESTATAGGGNIFTVQ